MAGGDVRETGEPVIAMNDQIYTRGGDEGNTCLGDGSRVSKASACCEAYGTLDEANAFVGAALGRTGDPMLRSILEFVAHRIYNCSSHLARGGADGEDPPVLDEDVAFLESAINWMTRQLAPLSHFVLPTGVPLAGILHTARTVVRRAERRIVALDDAHRSPELLRFVNRLSDLLFTAARFANHLAGQGDLPWRRELPIPDLESP